MKKNHFYILLVVITIIILCFLFIPRIVEQQSNKISDVFSVSVLSGQGVDKKVEVAPVPTLDKGLYDEKLLALANISSATNISTSTKKNTASTTSTSTQIKSSWPVKNVYPNVGALLPFNRIVAYYGNFYSSKMGVLGQYPPEQMLKMLLAEVEKWKEADPTTPVIPAIHYIAVTAQRSPGADGKYRSRMPKDQIEKAISLAEEVNGIVFLDVQDGLSNVQSEVPLLKDYLALPNVHLALDPEFSMNTSGKKPGTVIGTMDASDINFAADYLANIVKENNLPPKILVVHRFTNRMVTNSQNIIPLPDVQIVMDMDGWGGKPNKIKAYKDVIYSYPVQFTGLKLFYKNDLLPPSTGMLSLSQVLNFKPIPSYIQYQ